MSHKYIPYSCQQISESDVEAVVTVLRSEYLTQGPVVPAFEKEFSNYHKVNYAVAVSNATAALYLACLALDVGPGDIVWTSPNSFLASANCARYCGADIDFVDIDPCTRNLSIDALKTKLELASIRGKLPKLLIPVDFAGLPVDLKEIYELGCHYGFKILEDASHATGALYQGEPVGSKWADISVFSFHAVKVITAAEGGMLVTQDAAIARRLQLLRSHGMTREASEMDLVPEGPWVYEQAILGHNMRMSELHAALGLSQLRRLDTLHASRCRHASRYDELLADLPLKLPVRLEDRNSAWHLYAIELNRKHTTVSRADVFSSLRKAGIGVNVHYIPIHIQPYYQNLGFRRGDFPNAEAYYSQAISLPLFPSLSEFQQDYVISNLRSALLV